MTEDYRTAIRHAVASEKAAIAREHSRKGWTIIHPGSCALISVKKPCQPHAS